MFSEELHLTAADVEALSRLIVELKYKDAVLFVEILQRARKRANAEKMRHAHTDLSCASVNGAATVIPVEDERHQGGGG